MKLTEYHDIARVQAFVVPVAAVALSVDDERSPPAPPAEADVLDVEADDVPPPPPLPETPAGEPPPPPAPSTTTPPSP